MIDQRPHQRNKTNTMVLPRSFLWISLVFFGAGWIWLFWEHFPVLLGKWDTEDYSYCFLIPFVVGYLVWLVRGELKEACGGGHVLGYIGLVLSGILFLIGRLGSLETLIYLSMWLSLVAGVLIFLGSRSLKLLKFPLFLLAFIVPAPPFITQLLSFNLRLFSSALAVRALHVLGIPAYREGNIIDLGVTQLQVVDACSGLRYLVPTLIMAFIIGHLYHRRFWQKGLLVLLAPPVSVLINSFRVLIMSLLARFISPSLAQTGFFHDFIGWIVFFLSLASLFLASWGMRSLSKESRQSKKIQSSEHDGLVGSVVDKENLPQGRGGLGLSYMNGIIAGLFFIGLHLTQSALVQGQIIPEHKSFRSFPMAVNGWEGQRVYLDKAILESLWADDYVSGSFVNRQKGNGLHLLISYYESQTTHHTAHAPTSCLLGGGWDLKAKRVLGPAASAGRNFPVQQMLLEKNKDRLLSNFWFQQRGRVITSEYWNKYYLVVDSIARKRTDGALVRIEMALKPGQDIEEGQQILDTFIQGLAVLLPQYVPS